MCSVGRRHQFALAAFIHDEKDVVEEVEVEGNDGEGGGYEGTDSHGTRVPDGPAGEGRGGRRS